MSYSVHIYRREVQKKAAKNPAVLENPDQLVAFKKSDLKALEQRLAMVGFEERKKSARGRTFVNGDWGAEALLTATGLFLRGSGETAVFEIGMFASELADDELAKFDPQAGAWE